MKKLLCPILVLVMICAPLTAFAAPPEPVILVQPMNYVYGEYNTAIYSVLAEGTNLSATWYIVYNGKTYNTLEYNESDPWRAFAGESCGPNGSSDGNRFSFKFIFQGIEKGLDGAQIYCVIEDGHYDVASARARITVADGAAFPPAVRGILFEINGADAVTAAGATVGKGDALCVTCKADPAHPENGEQITWTWYESSSGKLSDIKAISEGPEYSDFFFADTSIAGTRYYFCMVESSTGGRTYSNAIPVTVLDAAPSSSGAAVQPPVLAKISLPDAEVGEDYGFLLECSDRTAGFAISYNPGKANDFDKTGLTLTPTGVLTGVPAKEGTYTFTVCASNAGGEDYMTYTLTVKPKSADPTTTSPASTAAPTSAASTSAAPAESSVPAESGESAGSTAAESAAPADTDPVQESTVPADSASAPADTSAAPSSSAQENSGERLPDWAIAVIAAVGAAGIAAAVTALIMKRKKK